jgi:hypothetical protein
VGQKICPRAAKRKSAIQDDPATSLLLSGAAQSASHAHRESVSQLYTKSIYTLLSLSCPVIFLVSNWHDDHEPGITFQTMKKETAYALYTCHALSTWNARSYEFAAVRSR